MKPQLSQKSPSVASTPQTLEPSPSSSRSSQHFVAVSLGLRIHFHLPRSHPLHRRSPSSRSSAAPALRSLQRLPSRIIHRPILFPSRQKLLVHSTSRLHALLLANRSRSSKSTQLDRKAPRLRSIGQRLFASSQSSRRKLPQVFRVP